MLKAFLGAFVLFVFAAMSVPERPLHPGAAIGEIAPTGLHSAINNKDALYLNMPENEVLKILDDPGNRVSDEFRLLPEIKATVGFWFLIYAKYSLYHTLVYDRDKHETPYEIIDNRDLFNRGLGPVALEIRLKRRVKGRLDQYRLDFKKLVKNPHTRFAPGTPGAHIVRVWGRKAAKEWRQIAAGLRSQAGQRDRVMQGIASADRFFPAMEAIFRKFSIPTEITRVPLVESSFNLRAQSKADAVGVWQFLERSATEYLVVDRFNKIDERLSPIKSTYAAAKMFKRNHKILGDWGLAIIAYNHGVRSLKPIRSKYHGDRIAKLLMRTKDSPLGYASRSYFGEFLAMLHAERYRDRLYGMPFRSFADTISIVRIKRPGSVFDLAAQYNISIHELRIYNPDLFDLKRRLPAGTRIVVPRKLGESLVSAPFLRPEIDNKRVPRGPDRGLASDDVEIIDYLK